MVELSVTSIMILVLFGPVALIVIYFVKNAKRILDMWNLTFRRARTVRADIHTLSNRVYTKFVVPNERGFFRFRKGVYHFPNENLEYDQRFRVPKADFIEQQIPSEDGKIIESEVEIEVEIKQHDGQMVTIKRRVPQYIVSHAKIKPKLLKLARRDDNGKIKITDEPPVSAVEVADALDSKIVRDITNASIVDLQMNRILIVSVISLIVLVLVGIGLYMKLNSITQQLSTLNALLGQGVLGA